MNTYTTNNTSGITGIGSSMPSNIYCDTNFPQDALMGAGGCSGGPILNGEGGFSLVAAGGAGGDGGGGIRIVADSVTVGSAGNIITNGTDGQAGQTVGEACGGTGGGGSAGGIEIILNGSTPATLPTNKAAWLTAYSGGSTPSCPPTPGGTSSLNWPTVGSSTYLGSLAQNQLEARCRFSSLQCDC